MSITTECKFNLLPQLAEAVAKEVEGVIKKTTLAVEANAKQRSRVDTGQMRAGWNSTFPSALTGVVSNPVEHTIYNEFGTKRMSAQPMIRPAIEDERGNFISDITRVLKSQGK